MTWPFRSRLVAVGLVWLGFLTVFGEPLTAQRPAPLEARAGVELLVTSPSDAGLGSLREAIIAADRAGTRARIEIRTPRIVLESPLPPLVNPKGVVIVASPSDTEIDARAIPGGPVLDVAAARSVVRGLKIRGAAGQGILVRAAGARLVQVTLANCDVGVHLEEGAEDLLVESSTFEDNGTGVRVATGASGVSVSNNRFSRHERAAVWALSPSPPRRAASPPLVVRQNRFDEDRISLVLVNVPGHVEDNEFARAGEAAIYLTGPGVVRRNRLQSGGGVGLFADAPNGALIEDNELDHNITFGLLLRQASRTEVLRNRVYENGYGIVVVFGDRSGNLVADNLVLSQGEDGLYVVGASPILRANRASGNRGVGLRVLDYVPVQGAAHIANPLLEDNDFRDNGLNAVQGTYHERQARPKAR